MREGLRSYANERPLAVDAFIVQLPGRKILDEDAVCDGQEGPDALVC